MLETEHDFVKIGNICVFYRKQIEQNMADDSFLTAYVIVIMILNPVELPEIVIVLF